MKIATFIMAGMIAIAAFSSCKKEKATPAFIIEGKWNGKIGTGNVSPASQFSLHLKPGGQLERINNAGNVTGNGTWQLTGKNFSGSYELHSGTKVSLTGTVITEESRLSGTWENNGGETGSWLLNTKE